MNTHRAAPPPPLQRLDRSCPLAFSPSSTTVNSVSIYTKDELSTLCPSYACAIRQFSLLLRGLSDIERSVETIPLDFPASPREADALSRWSLAGIIGRNAGAFVYGREYTSLRVRLRVPRESYSLKRCAHLRAVLRIFTLRVRETEILSNRVHSLSLVLLTVV